MKAIVYAAPGQFSYREVPTPRPAAGQILIRVHACGLQRLQNMNMDRMCARICAQRTGLADKG